MTAVIPMEMKEELVAAVEYIKILINRFSKLDPVKVWTFGEKLIEILCQKYTGHWYPGKPIKGQAYRCIRVNRQYQDDGFLDACSFSGLKYSELSLPKDITLWIDPYEVSCRLGEDGYPYTVASFHPSTTQPFTETLDSLEEVSFSSLNCYTLNSSTTSSPIPMDEDTDSGVEGSSDEACSRTESPLEEDTLDISLEQKTETQEKDSKPIFRTASPLWIPPCRRNEYDQDFLLFPYQWYWV